MLSRATSPRSSGKYFQSILSTLCQSPVTASQGMYITGIPINARPSFGSDNHPGAGKGSGRNRFRLIFNGTEEKAAAKGTLIKFP